jgi:glutaconate CoA-transferase subunit B
VSQGHSVQGYTRDEIMTVTAARQLQDGAVCFVGIGLPSAACNLARQTHAPGLVLIYESGTVDTKPMVLPLSIGDGELAETASCVVPLPEVFTFYLQGGRVDVGFLGAAQIDRFGNLNSTVIGDYAAPRVRLPGAGGAPEIATHAGEILILMRQSQRSFVEKLDFQTTPGFLGGGGERGRLGFPGAGPRKVITDYGLLEPDPATEELVLTSTYPGIGIEEVRDATGWPLKVASQVTELDEPTDEEISALRALHARTETAHAQAVRIALPA